MVPVLGGPLFAGFGIIAGCAFAWDSFFSSLLQGMFSAPLLIIFLFWEDHILQFNGELTISLKSVLNVVTFQETSPLHEETQKSKLCLGIGHEPSILDPWDPVPETRAIGGSGFSKRSVAESFLLSIPKLRRLRFALGNSRPYLKSHRPA